jgi:hypothetical protein
MEAIMPLLSRPRSNATAGRRKRRVLALGAAGALALTALVAAPAVANHPEVSLPGSDFEIDTDANLKVDDAAPSTDWVGVTENRQADLPTGSGDDSFGGGSKEDTPVPKVVDGSIPPNKSDLLNFGTYLEQTASGDFLHMFWHRVQEPSGTTNMDFEFNQSDVTSSNGVTPERTDGDLLIRYDLSQGGTNPQLFLSTWSGDAVSGNWVDQGSLTASGDATGSINTSAIDEADSDGLGDVSPRTFGEATVDFSAIVGDDECISFGSAYLKSRSSDAFTSALKDFIAPAPTDLTNCAKVIVHKETVPDGDTTSFDYTTVFTTQDDGTNPSFSLADGGMQEYDNVFFGTGLTVTESAPPTGWALTDIDCSASDGVTPSDVDTSTGTVTFDLDDADDVLECTYTNTLQTGSLLIVKERKHVADNDADPTTTGETHPHADVAFTVSDGDATTADIETSTGADGTVCVGPLVISSIAGDYTVTETVPEGYVADDASKDVTVTLGDGCDGTDDSVSVEFLNTPLTDLTVSVESQIEGGTYSSIECDATTEDPDTDMDVDLSDMQEDPSVTIPDLEPGTYTCVVVIDP